MTFQDLPPLNFSSPFPFSLWIEEAPSIPPLVFCSVIVLRFRLCSEYSKPPAFLHPSLTPFTRPFHGLFFFFFTYIYPPPHYITAYGYPHFYSVAIVSSPLSPPCTFAVLASTGLDEYPLFFSSAPCSFVNRNVGASPLNCPPLPPIGGPPLSLHLVKSLFFPPVFLREFISFLWTPRSTTPFSLCLSPFSFLPCPPPIEDSASPLMSFFLLFDFLRYPRLLPKVSTTVGFPLSRLVFSDVPLSSQTSLPPTSCPFQSFPTVSPAPQFPLHPPPPCVLLNLIPHYASRLLYSSFSLIFFPFSHLTSSFSFFLQLSVLPENLNLMQNSALLIP